MNSTASKNGIAGRIEVLETFRTKSGNAILRIRVDDVALTRLKELDFEVRVATAGKIRFCETKPACASTDNRAPPDKAAEIAERIQSLEEEIAVEKEKLDVMNKRVDEAETASVGSVGLSALIVEEPPQLMDFGDSLESAPPPVERVDTETENRLLEIE
jgi:hypothetical protein